MKPFDPAASGSLTFYKAGESTSSDVTFYTYDVWNQLTKTVVGDKTITYPYNGEGYRVSKAVNGEISNYLYEADKVILEVDGSGNNKAFEYIIEYSKNNGDNYLYSIIFELS